MRRRAALAFTIVGVALVCASPGAAGTVNVVLDSNGITLANAAGGSHTATVQLANLRDAAVDVVPSIPGDVGCVVTADPARIAAARRTAVILTLGSGCDTAGGADVKVDVSPHATPAHFVLSLAPAPSSTKADWGILVWSFVAAFGASAICLLVFLARMSAANDLQPPDGWSGEKPTVQELAPGPIPPGTYEYAVTTVGKNGESPPSRLGVVILHRKRRVQVELPDATFDTLERRVYRRDPDKTTLKPPLRRVGVVTDNDVTVHIDDWLPLRLTTELRNLGTDWSFKDNWVSSVTVGSSVFVALLAASNVLTAVLGAEPTAALGLLAVAGAVAALFVGLSPLVPKLIGRDPSVPTIGGTILAALLVLVGSLGQISTVTWQARQLVDDWRLLPWVVIVLGGVIGLIVISYAMRTLWAIMRTGSRFPATEVAVTHPDAAAPLWNSASFQPAEQWRVVNDNVLGLVHPFRASLTSDVGLLGAPEQTSVVQVLYEPQHKQHVLL